MPDSMKTKIVLRVTDETRFYYVNYAEVASSQSEFSLYGAQVPTKPSPDLMDQAQREGAMTLDSLFQIVLPVSVIDGLINALIKQKEHYEKYYNPISGNKENKNAT